MCLDADIPKFVYYGSIDSRSVLSQAMEATH